MPPMTNIVNIILSLLSFNYASGMVPLHVTERGSSAAATHLKNRFSRVSTALGQSSIGASGTATLRVGETFGIHPWPRPQCGISCCHPLDWTDVLLSKTGSYRACCEPALVSSNSSTIPQTRTFAFGWYGTCSAISGTKKTGKIGLSHRDID